MSAARIIEFPVERRRARRLVDLTEIRNQFGMSERWWRYQIAAGMPTHRWANRLRFDPDEVQAWLEERGRHGA